MDIYEYRTKDVSPLTGITWSQAQRLCTINGKRLCSSTEWSLAAGKTTTFVSLRKYVHRRLMSGAINYGIDDRQFWDVSLNQIHDMIGSVWEDRHSDGCQCVTTDSHGYIV